MRFVHIDSKNANNYPVNWTHIYSKYVIIKESAMYVDGTIVCGLNHEGEFICLEGFDRIFKVIDGDIIGI